jgi:ectoine hydroxylase-related dioxygenase (phytanoyl-CoA dioxygenase family)
MNTTLSVEQLDSYEKRGILFPISILTPSEVGQFRGSLEALEFHLGPQPSPKSFRQLHLHHTWAFDLATHPAVLDAVEDILGDDILVHSTSLFHKRAYDGAYVSWHQDGYYWGLETPRLVSAWIALSNSTRENGCMRVVPGSHKSGQLRHGETALSEHNLLTSGLEIAVEVDENLAADVVLRAGEMSLHHVDIVHGSEPNRSNTDRIGFAVRYLGAGIRQSMPHHAVVLARGRNIGGCFELAERPPECSIEEAIAAQAEFVRHTEEIRNRARTEAAS